MGCILVSRNEYFDWKCEEELLISHKYEDEALNAYSRPFSSFFLSILRESNTISIKKLDDVVLRDYSEQMLLLLSNPFFLKVAGNGQKAYSTKRIQYLFYLLSKDTLIKTDRKSIHDKIGFLYMIVKNKSTDLLNQTINKDDTRLNKALSLMVHISCVVLIDEYMKNSRMKKFDENMIKIRACENKISQSYIRHLFTIKDQEQNSISYQEIEWQFDGNCELFTSRDIRRYGWDLIANRNE